MSNNDADLIAQTTGKCPMCGKKLIVTQSDEYTEYTCLNARCLYMTTIEKETTLLEKKKS